MISEFTGDYRFLSNFWPYDIPFEGTVFPSVEHAYQAAKVTGPEHNAHVLNILWKVTCNDCGKRIFGLQILFNHCGECETKNLSKIATTPGQAKREGNSKGILLRPDWEQVKLKIMEQLLRIKFQDPVLREALLKTYPQKLIEGNTWGDTFWGQCNGIGKNHLGKLLMQIRKELHS